MKLYVFGNEDYQPDSLPLRILPQLQTMFPQNVFVVKDPNEEWEDVEEINVIDVVMGIDKITIFKSLSDFSKTPRNSMHDFDAYTNLIFLEKLGKLKKVKIIGVPSSLDEKQAIEKIAGILNAGF